MFATLHLGELQKKALINSEIDTLLHKGAIKWVPQAVSFHAQLFFGT